MSRKGSKTEGKSNTAVNKKHENELSSQTQQPVENHTNTAAAAQSSEQDVTTDPGVSQSAEQTFDTEGYFEPSMITDEVFNRMWARSYKEDCTVPRDALRYVPVLYYDFSGAVQKGELVVNARIAQDTANVFRELYAIHYPIEKIRLVDDYDADDNRSMADNNTSAFNFRKIDGSTRLSNHAEGFAIDINPLYNPYVRTKNGVQQVLPENAAAYADRNASNPYYICKGDACYEIFKKYGFSWGGEWNSSKDYQHFEKVIK